MAILAIDTCLAKCSAAIFDPATEAIAARTLDLGVGHAEHLAPLVHEVLEQSSISAKEIDTIVTTIGPGSFMGVRVGISFAKGFGFPHGAKYYPISSLQAIWSASSHENGFALIDARRDQVYGQGFGSVACDPFLLDLEDTRSKVGHTDQPLVGTGVPVLFEDRQSDGEAFPQISWLAKHGASFPEGPLTPLYLRPPDAKPMARPK